MKTKVIKDRCIGCGACTAICPEIYGIDDDGLAIALNEEINDEYKENASIASESCPVSAIEIE